MSYEVPSSLRNPVIFIQHENDKPKPAVADEKEARPLNPENPLSACQLLNSYQNEWNKGPFAKQLIQLFYQVLDKPHSNDNAKELGNLVYKMHGLGFNFHVTCKEKADNKEEDRTSREILNEKYLEGIDLFCKDREIRRDEHVKKEYIEEMLQRVEPFTDVEESILGQLYVLHKFRNLNDFRVRNKTELLAQVEKRFPDIQKNMEGIFKRVIEQRKFYQDQMKKN